VDILNPPDSLTFTHRAQVTKIYPHLRVWTLLRITITMSTQAAVNLSTYSLSLLTAKEDILNPRSSTNWYITLNSTL